MIVSAEVNMAKYSVHRFIQLSFKLFCKPNIFNSNSQNHHNFLIKYERIKDIQKNVEHDLVNIFFISYKIF